MEKFWLKLSFKIRKHNFVFKKETSAGLTVFSGCLLSLAMARTALWIKYARAATPVRAGNWRPNSARL